MSFDLGDLMEAKKPEPEKRGRGRPRKHESDSAKQAAYRERKGLVPFTVNLPQDVIDGINAYMKFKSLTKTEVLEKLIRTQLMRKR